MGEPIRMCIACKKRRSKYELLRFVEREGVVYFDPNWRWEGRGVNLCASRGCIEIAVRKGLFSVGFKKPVKAVEYNWLLGEVTEGLKRVITNIMRIGYRYKGIVLGRKAVSKAIDKIALVILAKDLSERSKKEFVGKGIPYIEFLTMKEWGDIFGKRPLGIIGIKDVGLSQKFLLHARRFSSLMEVS